MNILNQIVADKHAEIARRKKEMPISTFDNTRASTADFYGALQSKPIGLIAEVKRRSPSAGTIRSGLDPFDIALQYTKNGASAISCLIDNTYFGGGDEDFQLVQKATHLPLLYKEFVIDEWQIAHAKYLGASAILLIASVLEDSRLKDFSDCIINHGLSPLVEVHDQREIERAINIGARCIGINNRNLQTFETSLNITYNLISQVPKGTVVISESGIKSSEDARQLKASGADALLVGEQLLVQENPGAALKELLSNVAI